MACAGLCKAQAVWLLVSRWRKVSKRAEPPAIFFAAPVPPRACTPPPPSPSLPSRCRVAGVRFSRSLAGWWVVRVATFLTSFKKKK